MRAPDSDVLVFGGLPLPSSWASEGIAEATVPSAVVPLKHYARR